MSDIHHYGLFVLAAIVLILTPGQDTLYILGRSLSGGLRAGVASALGITAGSVVHTFAAAAGLSLLLRAFPVAFVAVKLCGAAYLIYLGARLLLARHTGDDLTIASPPSSARRAFVRGALSYLLNPKVALFFLAFLPQFIDPQGASKSVAFLALGATFVSMGGIWCLVLACAAAARLRIFLVRDAVRRRRIDRGVGALFMLLGARLAWGR
ncbi:MAG TPA: LysE family translocator [Candidatus Dormibacteraeota bacterium]|nr:LysE family translocator [Candidatus Dormibacteraeota bacterium]